VSLKVLNKIIIISIKKNIFYLYIYSSILITYFTINFHKDSIINSKFFFLKRYNLNQVTICANVIAIITSLLYLITKKNYFYLLTVIIFMFENIYELAFGLSNTKKIKQHGMHSHHLGIILMILIFYNFEEKNKYIVIFTYLIINLIHLIHKFDVLNGLKISDKIMYLYIIIIFIIIIIHSKKLFNFFTSIDYRACIYIAFCVIYFILNKVIFKLSCDNDEIREKFNII